jgi:hypothetical protein
MEDEAHGHASAEPPRDEEGRRGWGRFAAEIVAGHARAWSATDGVVRLGPTGIEVRVSVEGINDAGASKAATLFFDVGGPSVGMPALSTFSGYGRDPLTAVVEGCCMWSQLFTPVILAGYGGEAALATIADDPSLERPEMFTFDGEVQLAVVYASFGRVMHFAGDDSESRGRLDAARSRLCRGSRPLTELVLPDAVAGIVNRDRPSLVSTFVMDSANGRVTEVKVNGGDWPAAHEAFNGRPPEPPGAMVLLRELAVVSPVRPTTEFPTRSAIEKTLAGLALRAGPTGSAETWPGWAAHQGRLAAPATPDAGLGELPASYQVLLDRVGIGGASPGYGLASPKIIDDAIPLAFAGCGCSWLLRLDPRHRGEVWYDAAGSDETTGYVAPSATAWYELWLDAVVRNRGAWIQWDHRACAPMNVLAQVLEAPAHAEQRQRRDLSGTIRPGGLAISGGVPYLANEPQPLDPCQGCVATFASWGLEPSVFAPGVLGRRPTSIPASSTSPTEPRRGRFRRK